MGQSGFWKPVIPGALPSRAPPFAAAFFFFNDPNAVAELEGEAAMGPASLSGSQRGKHLPPRPAGPATSPFPPRPPQISHRLSGNDKTLSH